MNATKSVYEIEILDDDSQIKRGKEIQEDGSLLVFDTRVHDQGIYKCIATNVMGQAVKSVNLTVREGMRSVTIQMKATEQYFPVVLFIMLNKMVLTFVDEILKCDHSNKSY